jgi:ubiquinone/menaquinone biosynthesis C-methylase UbiE
VGLYRDHLLPRLTELVCGAEEASRRRAALVPQAHGSVLEVGVGPGLNLPFYSSGTPGGFPNPPARVERLIAIDPSPGMLARARRQRAGNLATTLLMATAEALPVAAGSIDTAVVTFTLCSVADPAAALAELRRVLQPGGILLFCEHGLAPDPHVRRWQRRLEPLWRPLAGGCHLTRDVGSALEDAGFRIVTIERGYVARLPRFGGYLSCGTATPR